MENTEQGVKVTVISDYVAPYFNTTCYANIPGHYRLEVLDAAEAMGETETHFSHFYLYADGFNFQEAFDSIVDELKRFGHGSMKLVGDIPPRQQWHADIRDGR